MNTKAIIGLIIVVIIIGGIVWWLVKTPASPIQPVAPTVPALSDTSGTDTTGAAPSTAAPTIPAPAPTSASTKTIQGMKIDVTKEGSGSAIVNGQTASMLYTGKLTDGTVFDSTASRNNTPFTFTLGAGQVIKGWDLGVAGMKVGEERTLTIPADLAYGANGVSGVIPPNATLVFNVTLVGIK